MPERPDDPTPGTPTPGAPSAEGTGTAPTSRRRDRGASLLVAVLVGVLGFAITTQVGQDDSTDYSSLRGVELVELLKSVDAANERLGAQIEELTTTRDQLLSSRDRTAETEEVAQARAEQLAVLSGTVGATGPGVRLVIDDPNGVVDAGTVLDVLQELRDAGAEAIVVDETARVVAQTYVLDDGGSLRIGGREVRSPYVFEVIGDPDTLAEAARFRGGIVDDVAARGATATVETRDSITITALADVRTPEYARADPDGS